LQLVVEVLHRERHLKLVVEVLHRERHLQGLPLVSDGGVDELLHPLDVLLHRFRENGSWRGTRLLLLTPRFHRDSSGALVEACDELPDEPSHKLVVSSREVRGSQTVNVQIGILFELL